MRSQVRHCSSPDRHPREHALVAPPLLTAAILLLLLLPLCRSRGTSVHGRAAVAAVADIQQLPSGDASGRLLAVRSGGRAGGGRAAGRSCHLHGSCSGRRRLQFAGGLQVPAGRGGEFEVVKSSSYHADALMRTWCISSLSSTAHLVERARIVLPHGQHLLHQHAALLQRRPATERRGLCEHR